MGCFAFGSMASMVRGEAGDLLGIRVVDQITSWMGSVRWNIASKGQVVRGIIVVGRPSERLEYSLDLILDVRVRTFFRAEDAAVHDRDLAADGLAFSTYLFHRDDSNRSTAALAAPL